MYKTRILRPAYLHHGLPRGSNAGHVAHLAPVSAATAHTHVMHLRRRVVRIRCSTHTLQHAHTAARTHCSTHTLHTLQNVHTAKRTHCRTHTLQHTHTSARTHCSTHTMQHAHTAAQQCYSYEAATHNKSRVVSGGERGRVVVPVVQGRRVAWTTLQRQL